MRDFSIDFIKCLAILGVVLIHSCNCFYPIKGIAWTTNIFFSSVLRCAVPLFLMCSGTLMLNPEKNISLKSIFTKYLPRLIAAMVFWSICYKVFHLIALDSLSLPSFFNALKEVLMFNQEFHMYYMQMIIIVYLFLPITRVFIKNCSRRELLYALSLWFIFGILYPTMRHFDFVQKLSGLANQYLINMTYASIGYTVLGIYIKKYPLKKLVCLICCIAGFCITFFGTVIVSAKTGAFCDTFFEGMSIGVFLSAIGIFGFSRYINNFGFLTKIVTYLSNASFCIYLVHIFFVFVIYKLNFLNFLPQIIYIPICTTINLALSTLVYFIISHIPVINKYII